MTTSGSLGDAAIVSPPLMPFVPLIPSNSQIQPHTSFHSPRSDVPEGLHRDKRHPLPMRWQTVFKQRKRGWRERIKRYGDS
ncbi:hypothetical protein BDM02DRAFT_3124018 [Thelephora ganbajun]|uniref:Uncharacterized protein n=1 Tax=Thelephora ganbajun TaxID=370292 RepID=A0ACB6YZP0_THEGA|nr:hypothetical protein BDM02DRAFT_3124018 [Thelephora ganbajun]